MAQSPPDFERRIGFVHIEKARHEIDVSVLKRTAFVTSTIEFHLVDESGANRPRCPIIDLAHPEQIERVTIAEEDGDEHEVRWVRTCSPDARQSARFLVLDREVEPDKSYTATFHHALRLERDDSGDDGSLVFFRMSHAKHFQFGRRDRDTDRLFLDRYLPANFEFDHHRVVVRVTVDKKRGLVLFTNGKATWTDENGDEHSAVDDEFKLQKRKFKVKFPKAFTCSSPFFFLGRRSLVKHHEIENPGGPDWPPGGVVLFGPKQRLRLERRELTSIVQARLPQVIRDFGPYPHKGGPLLLLASRYGIEYVNAAEVSVGNVVHELVHMYWGRCIMPRDGNAGWIDEAIAHWYVSGCQLYPTPPDPNDPTPLASGSPYQRATLLASRSVGPMVLGHIDWILQQNGRPDLRAFLRDFVGNGSLKVISSEQFREALLDARPAHRLEIAAVFKHYVDG